MKEIRSYEELLEYAFGLLDNTKAIEPVAIVGGMDYTIKIKGKTWGGFIDWRLAKLILGTQTAVNRAFKEAGIELSKKEQEEYAIKFRVTEGCSFIEIKPGKAIQALLDKMTGAQKTAIAIVLILAATGFLTTKTYYGYRERAEERAANEATKQELVKLTKQVVSKIGAYEMPVKGLASRLHDEDTVTISSRGEEFTKEQLKEEYPRKGRGKAINAYIDDTYYVHTITFEPDHVRFQLQKGAHRFDCGVMLNEADLALLYHKAQEQHVAGGGAFEMALQVTAKYTKSSGIHDAAIYGLGAPRDGAMTISNLQKME